MIHATVDLYALVGRLKFRTPTFPKAGAAFSLQCIVQFVSVHFVIKSLTLSEPFTILQPSLLSSISKMGPSVGIDSGLKPQSKLSNGRLYSNTAILPAVDGWVVTFGTARRGLDGLWPRPSAPHCIPDVTAHPSTASVPTSYYSMRHYNCICMDSYG